MPEETRVQPCNENEASVQYVPGIEREPGDNPGGFVRADPQTWQTPTVGRCVHYTPPLAHHNPHKGFQPYPATITHVWSPTCVNLKVDNDGSFPLPSDSLMPMSVNFAEKPNETERTWSWPPRSGS